MRRGRYHEPPQFCLLAFSMAYKSRFQIESTADSLVVGTASQESAVTFVLYLIVVGLLTFRFFLPQLGSLHQQIQSLSRPPVGELWSTCAHLLLAGLFLALDATLVFQAIRSLFPSGEALRCDHENLVIGRIPWMNFQGKWAYNSFPVPDVKQMQFTAIRPGSRGGGTGLMFIAGGKKYEVFPGLESPEASRILDALSALHVDILRDPAMPMMVEMAESRRKSRIGLF